MLPIFTVIGGLIGVVVTALVTAYLGRRSKSGKVETSEAKDLWDTLRGELSRLQTESTALRTEIKDNRTEMTALRTEATSLLDTMGELRVELQKCHESNTELLERLKADK